MRNIRLTDGGTIWTRPIEATYLDPRCDTIDALTSFEGADDKSGLQRGAEVIGRAADGLITWRWESAGTTDVMHEVTDFSILGDRLYILRYLDSSEGPQLGFDLVALDGVPAETCDYAPPVGSVAVAGGATHTRNATVTVRVAATDAGTVTHVALSNDGTTWTTRSYAPSQTWTLPSSNGTKRVYAKWKDAAGNWSAVTSDTIVLDTVAPSSGKPGRAFLKGKAIANGLIPTRIAWTGSDATSGIARYELAQQTNGGPWATVAPALTNVLTDRPLAGGASYRFRVRAVDKAGNVSAWAYGDTFRVSRFSEGNSRITYSGTWSTSRYPVFWGGAAKASSKAGSRASITFTGRSVAWVSSMGPTRGKADVLVNGVKVATVDLYSATSKHQQVVWASGWTTAASRTITIRVQGTGGRPRVDLDAFVTAN